MHEPTRRKSSLNTMQGTGYGVGWAWMVVVYNMPKSYHIVFRLYVLLLTFQMIIILLYKYGVYLTSVSESGLIFWRMGVTVIYINWGEYGKHFWVKLGWGKTSLLIHKLWSETRTKIIKLKLCVTFRRKYSQPKKRVKVFVFYMNVWRKKQTAKMNFNGLRAANEDDFNAVFVCLSLLLYLITIMS